MRTNPRTLATVVAILTLALVPFAALAQDITVTSVDNYGGKSNVTTDAPNTDVIVTELDADKKPVRSWAGKTDAKGRITIEAGSNLSTGYVRVKRAGAMPETLIAPSEISANEPFTFAVTGVVEGEVIDVKSVDGEVVATKKADKLGRIFLPVGLASGAYLLTSHSGQNKVAGTIRVNPAPTNVAPRPLGHPNDMQLFRADEPVRFPCASSNPDASKLTAILGDGSVMPVMASDGDEVVLAPPTLSGIQPGKYKLRIVNPDAETNEVSQNVAFCQITVSLARKTLLSGESTTLEFKMQPQDLDTDIRAVVLTGPITFPRGELETTVHIQDGAASEPVQTIAGQTGRFQIGWMFSPPPPLLLQRPTTEVDFVRDENGDTHRTETTKEGETVVRVKKNDTHRDADGIEWEVEEVQEFVDGVQVGGYRDTIKIHPDKKREVTKHEVWDKDKDNGKDKPKGGYVVPPKK